jgi:hypothetical protein
MLKGSFQNDTVINPATPVTASGNSASVQVGGYNGLVAYLNVTAVSGTTPSLTIKVQDSADGTTWYDVPSAAFTAVTATGQQRLVVNSIGNFVRAVSTVSGTTPSFTASLTVAGIN